MGYKIKLLPIAHADLRKAKKWYYDKNPEIAEAFKNEVNKEIDYIGKYPEHYQLHYKELRHSLIAGFPYVIFYLVEKEKMQIVVFGLLHMSRNPEEIKKRMT